MKISKSNIGKDNHNQGDLHVSAREVIFTKDSIDIPAKGIRKFCRDNNIHFSSIIWRLRNNKVIPTKDGWTVRYA